MWERSGRESPELISWEEVATVLTRLFEPSAIAAAALAWPFGREARRHFTA